MGQAAPHDTSAPAEAPELTIVDRREVVIYGGVVIVETRSDGAVILDGKVVEPATVTAEKLFKKT